VEVEVLRGSDEGRTADGGVLVWFYGRFWRPRVGIKTLGGGKCLIRRPHTCLHFLYPGQARRRAFAFVVDLFWEPVLASREFGFRQLGVSVLDT
jgi:hypothetical protein